MSDEDWDNPFTACLGLFLAGKGMTDVDEDGVPLRDDDLFLLLNASHEDLDFVMPKGLAAWELLLDTADDQAVESRETGETTRMAGRSLKLFRCPIV
jgi:glycogen operon protein